MKDKAKTKEELFEELKESEERYRSLIEGTYDIVQSVRPDGSFDFVNKAWLEALGYTEEELPSLDMWKIIHPESLPHCKEIFSRVVKGEKVGNIQATFVAKDGRPIMVEGNATCRHIEGKIFATHGFFRDVTERKKAEEKIKHFDLVLRAIRDVNQLIVKEKDRDKLIKGACDNLVKTRGYRTAWLALLDGSGKLVESAEAGLGKKFLPMHKQLKHAKLPVCGQRTLKQANVVTIEDPSSTCSKCSLAKNYGGGAAMSTRLEYGGKVYGLLTVSTPPYFIRHEEEASLFREVAEDIAFALHGLEVEEERKKAEEELKERVEELEKFHTFVVGRELKMVELKEEIERLKREKRK